MNEQLEREVKSYLKSIRYILPYSHTKKNKYLNNLQGEIEAYLEDHKDASIEDIREAFGTPGEIMDSIFDAEDGEKLLQSLKIGRWIKRVVLIVCIILVAIVTTIVLKDYMESVAFRNGYYIETIEDYGFVSSTD